MHAKWNDFHRGRGLGGGADELPFESQVDYDVVDDNEEDEGDAEQQPHVHHLEVGSLGK